MERQLFIFILSLFAMWACSDKETSGDKATGYLAVNISSGTVVKAGVEIADFTLRIINSEGVTVQESLIGELPPEIVLSAGEYTVEAFSAAFSGPEFETPCYSGRTSVEIVAGETSAASLVCSQSNAGIKIVWSGEFADLYQTYQAEARCAAGYLTYSAAESRTGYFLPGTVSIHISADGQNMPGGNIVLASGDLATVTLRPKTLPSGGLSIDLSIDETVNQREIEIIADSGGETGEPAGENSEANPYSISQAIERQGETAVWVVGYIVGAKPSSGYDFASSGTWQATNIVLAGDVAETSDTGGCIFVELGTGSFRTDLNLPAHPELLHRKIVIRGELATYQSRPGLRNITNYAFK